ncbi:MAG: stage II sporulation protein M [Candidatus Hecatellaceae archaeon]
MKSEFPLGLVLLSLTIFAVGAAAGYLSAEKVSEQLMKVLSEELSPFAELPPPLLALAIFTNNFSKTLIIMLLGLLFAVPPVLFILANGFILGVVGFEVIECKGILFLALGVLPHGVFEVSAAALSTALGIKIGIAAYRRAKRRSFEVQRTLKLCLKTYFSLVVPLLFLAALVETYVTPLFLGSL